ncbi:MAG TPA: hypothetical protein VII06_09650 [Chloroflexota bacterium]|jgi:hypothetical protein
MSTRGPGWKDAAALVALTPKGYTTPDRVAAYMGVTLTPAQEDAATELIVAAEEAIDRATGRRWLESSPAVETWPIIGNLITLRMMPILGVTQVQTIGEPLGTFALLATSSWRIVDLDYGQLYVGGSWVRGAWAEVTYTFDATYVPAQITLAATMYASHYLSQSTTGIGADVASYSIGPYQTVSFRQRPADSGEPPLPPGVGPLLTRFKRQYVT